VYSVRPEYHRERVSGWWRLATWLALSLAPDAEETGLAALQGYVTGRDTIPATSPVRFEYHRKQPLS
jgi:hypothetical protein